MKPCTVAGCTRPAKAKGICGTHYERLRLRGGLELTRSLKFCGVAGCGRKHFANGFCNMHRQRVAKHGDPLIVLKVNMTSRRVPEEVKRERAKRSKQEYYQLHRERFLAVAEHRRKSNPDANRNYQLRHYREKPDLYKSHARNRKMRLRGAFVEHVDAVKVYQRDGWVCGICGTPVERSDASLDHVIPVSRGGKHSYANVQCAHLMCNIRKGARV